VGFLDALLGRTKPAQPDLDKLFGLPGARITLEAAEGIEPTNQAGVCFKPASGEAFAATEQEVCSLLNLGDEKGAEIKEQSDQYGYQWIVLDAGDFDSLVTRVHMANSTLQDNGYGPALLCSVFGFRKKAADGAPEPPASIYLVYLYKRGSFYPFVPMADEKRDNESELRLKNELGEDLSIEKDLDRWFPLWGLPVH
jgi:hypothetical protein